MLGGNASSEVRLWVLGATAHMGNNNRWAREGGVVDEIIVENTYRNKDGNSIIFDTILLEKVVEEPNITLLLNTAMVGSEVVDGKIGAVSAFCSQNSTRYEITAPLFADCTGDGTLAFSAGAGFRMGAEAASEFGELFAPTEEYGPLLGHSMYFYSKDVGHPVAVHPAVVRPRRPVLDPAGAQLQHQGGRLPALVDRVGRPARHGARHRDDQVGAVEGDLRRLGSPEELR